MVARAAVQAYRQAVISMWLMVCPWVMLGVLLDGQRSGVTAETLRSVTSRQMQLEEARKILGIEDNLAWTDIVKVSTIQTPDSLQAFLFVLEI